MKFSPDFLDDIRTQLPVSEVVGQKIRLKKVGREWKGLSPFVPEKSPSFVVNDGKRFFHDFATGKHGDIFDFLVETEGVSHSTAVERLAVLAGFTANDIEQHRLPRRITSYLDARVWLGSQSYQGSLTYSSRAALRAIPNLVSLPSFEDDSVRPLLLACFRANASAWVAARYPSHKDTLRSLAKAASKAMLSAAEPWMSLSPANRATGRAAAAAARAAEKSSASASGAVLNIESIFNKHSSVASGVSDLEMEGITSDIAALDAGLAPIELNQRPLWLNGIPAKVRSEWTRLEAALLAFNEDWSVWTSWYESRLNGDFAEEAVEIARASLAPKLWKQHPATVNAKIKRIVNEGKQESKASLLPLENIPSPFSFQISNDGKIVLASSPSNAPQFPYLNSRREQADRLNACRTLAEDMISDLKGRKFQARSEYIEGFEKYASRLPSDLHEGNFLLAEAEARTLRNLFAAEASILSVAFAAKLKTFLEQHIGLRVFYPDVANFYRDVKSGRMVEPLPLDAIEGVLNGVRANTPTVFEPTVQGAIEGSLNKSVTEHPSAQDMPAVDGTQPLPPNDPLGEIDPHKASDFTFAGTTNGIWKAFLQGEKIHKALDGWAKTREALAPHVSEIIGWLHRFIAAGNGSPPTPPNLGI